MSYNVHNQNRCVQIAMKNKSTFVLKQTTAASWVALRVLKHRPQEGAPILLLHPCTLQEGVRLFVIEVQTTFFF